MKNKGLSGNQLKLIAMLCMTIDHVGYILLPRVLILRAIGRLAFPIFAYMIAEGCRHTRSMGKYLAGLMVSGFVCQTVYWVAMRSLYMCIMVTFSLSVGLIWLIQEAEEKKTAAAWATVVAGVFLALFATEVLPGLLQGTDYGVDYGFVGVMLPVTVYLCKKRWQELAVMTLLLSWLAWGSTVVQWYALAALPLLALYGGHRGKWKLKWMFYIYYPVHLAAIWLLYVMIR